MPTEKANVAMAELLDRARRLRITRLDSELEAYLKDGFALESDGTIVSVAALRGTRSDRSAFADLVGYEAFVNKIHLDDWCSDALTDAGIEEKLAHALVLADRVGEWAEHRGTKVAVVISADLEAGDIVFRFHRVRTNEPSWLAELKLYTEPVLRRLYGPTPEPG